MPELPMVDLRPPVRMPVAAPVDYAGPDVAARMSPLRLVPELAPKETGMSRWIGLATAILLTVLYGLMIFSFWAPAHPGVDQNGYLVGGKQFARTLSTEYTPEDPVGFVGRMWVRMEDGEHYPKYPLGLPILFAASLWIGGDAQGSLGYTMATAVSPLCATLTVLGIFLLGRRIAGSFAGIISMFLLGCGQVMLTLSTNPNSHAPAICFVVWGMYFVVSWMQTGQLIRGLAGGFILGFAYLIRYTDGLLVLPLALACLFVARWYVPRWWVWLSTIGLTALLIGLTSHLWKPGEDVRHNWSAWTTGLSAIAIIFSTFIRPSTLWRCLLVGGAWLVPVGYQTAFNLVHMGSITGYDTTNESVGFSYDYFLGNWERMLRTLHDVGLFFTFPIGMIGMLMLMARQARIAILLWLWMIPSVLLYAAYYWSPEGGVSYARFVLTQLPPLVLSAAWVLTVGLRMVMGAPTTIRDEFGGERLAPRGLMTMRGAYLAIVAAGVIATSSGVTLWRAVYGFEGGARAVSMEVSHRSNLNLAVLARRAIAEMPAGSTLFAEEGRHLNFLQFVGDFECFPIDQFSRQGIGRLTGRRENDPNEPDPIQPARRDYLISQLGNKNDAELSAELVRIITETTSAGRRAFFIIRSDQTETVSRHLQRSPFETVERATIVDQPRVRPADELNPPDTQRRQPQTWAPRNRQPGNQPPGQGRFLILEAIRAPQPANADATPETPSNAPANQQDATRGERPRVERQPPRERPARANPPTEKPAPTPTPAPVEEPAPAQPPAPAEPPAPAPQPAPTTAPADPAPPSPPNQEPPAPAQNPPQP